MRAPERRLSPWIPDQAEPEGWAPLIAESGDFSEPQANGNTQSPETTNTQQSTCARCANGGIPHHDSKPRHSSPANHSSRRITVRWIFKLFGRRSRVIKTPL
jgi:hypothetical protein